MDKNKKGTKHDSNRTRICILCLNRCSKTNLFSKIVPKGETEKLINTHFKYNAKDWHLPCGLCNGCRSKLYRYKKGTLNAIEYPDLSQFCVRKVNTRSRTIPKDEACDCFICKTIETPTRTKPVNQDELNTHQEIPKQSNFVKFFLKYDNV